MEVGDSQTARLRRTPNCGNGFPRQLFWVCQTCLFLFAAVLLEKLRSCVITERGNNRERRAAIRASRKATLVEQSPIRARVSSPRAAPPSSWNAPTNTKGVCKYQYHLMYRTVAACATSALSLVIKLSSRHLQHRKMGQNRRLPGRGSYSTTYCTVQSSGSRHGFGEGLAASKPDA